jgi:hypothetical protein
MYSNNTKKAIWVVNRVIVEEAVFWVVASCGWVFASRRFEETYGLHTLGYESIHVLITLKMKAACFFETSGSNYPTTRHNNLEDCFLNTAIYLR